LPRRARHGAVAAFLLLFAAVGSAQRFSAALIGGAGLTSDIESPGVVTRGVEYTLSPDRYIAGLELEARLAAGLSFAAGVVYRPLGYMVQLPAFPGSLAHNTVITWELPLLVRYKLPLWESPGVAPFVEAGPAARLAGNLNTTWPSHTGIAAGAGFEIAVAGFRIAPELRYIRWKQDLQGQPFTDPNDLEVLLRFGPPRGTVRRLAHGLSFGFVLGATLTPDYPSVTDQVPTNQNGQPVVETFAGAPGPRGVTGGPALQCALFRGFAVEADALERTWRSSTQNGGSSPILTSEQTWEFPLMARYKLGPAESKRMKPFFEAGLALRTSGDLPKVAASRHGVTAGAGFEGRFGRIKIAPTIRYTRWAHPELPLGVTYGPNLDEAMALLGVSF